MELKINLRQIQSLSPQMIQATKLLQMGIADLREYLQEQLMENPVLESEEYSQIESRKNRDFIDKLDWLCSGDIQNRSYYRDDAQNITEWISTETSVGESLYEHLRTQINFHRLSPALRDAVECIIQSLNSSGWLDESVTDLVVHAGTSETDILRAIELVQGLEPAGVAARNLSECLILQLLRQGETGLSIVIARDYLEDMRQDHYHSIAKKTDSTQEEVRAACKLIRSLNPRPGAGFASTETANYFVPDLAVFAVGNGFEIVANDTYIPSLRISSYYDHLMTTSDDAEVRDYLSEKLKQAKWVVQAVEQRRFTLLACAEHIVKRQDAFFRFGPGHLLPMALTDIATEIGVHESTVSRAIQDKYLQCVYGVFPLKYFFSRALAVSEGAEDASADRAKAALRLLIQGENKKKPLSDQKLCQLLAGQGIQISRRTVAKYRDEMGIPSTNGRKEI